MEFIGFFEETTKWFNSSLSLRKPKLHMNNTFSESGNLQRRDFQGSILEPFLFLFYINDMPHAVECELLLMST